MMRLNISLPPDDVPVPRTIYPAAWVVKLSERPRVSSVVESLVDVCSDPILAAITHRLPWQTMTWGHGELAVDPHQPRPSCERKGLDMPNDRPGFRVQIDAGEGIHVISVFGEVDVASAPALDQALAEAMGSEATSVVLDLAGVTFLDSAGIRVLLSAVTASRDGDRKLSVRRDYQPPVDRVLALAGVIEELPYLATAQAGTCG
jgi:anti-sigma B factor antagonist